MSSEALPTTWKITAAAGCWLVYLPVAVLLWSKRHLPLFLMAIPLAVMVLFLGVSLLIVTVRAAHLSHVGVRLLLLTHALVVVLALTVFSVAEWALHGSLYAAAATALASAIALLAIVVRRPGGAVVDGSIGRLLLKFRLWTFAEIFVLFAIYALSLRASAML